MTAEPMIIFTRSYDFITWLIPKTASFPRSQRFIVTKRLQDAALNFQEFIIEANRQRGRMRLERLRQADANLDKVRLYLRLSVRWQWLTEGQYHHVSRMVKELGDLLGGWIKQTIGTKRPSS
ncbi:MAG: diversity-generating retroelement protein Avd [Desulfobacterales bacterium]